MPLLDLPPEIVDHILQFLASNKPTLRSLAVTCRSFLPRARHHLLRTAHIRKPAQAVKLITTVECSPRLQQSVRRLRLDYDSPLIPQLLARLPELRSVSLTNAPSASTMLWVDRPIEGGTHVETLSLRVCTFPDASTLRSFVARFPSLRSLRLRSVRVRTSAIAPGSTADDIMANISDLTLSRTTWRIFVGWAPIRLSRVSITMYGSPADDTYCRFIEQMCPRLSVLRLKLSETCGMDYPDECESVFQLWP
jgi:hypothetical protein